MAKAHEAALLKTIYQNDIFENVLPKNDNEIIGKKLKQLYEIAKKYNVNYLNGVSSHKRKVK